MNPIGFLTRIFIDVFGITRPTPQQERRASIFIGSLLLVVLLLFLFVAYAFFHGFHR
jgi:hypothetical protein